jgi:tRNA A37 threonylcarbamoyladenosine synthetase subunit TsaC/SUA5/YrdC
VRVTPHPIAQAIVAELGEPLVSSTLLLPGDSEPMTLGWDIKERLDHVVDAVVDGGECGTTPTTVVDLSGGEPEILRVGAGDPSRFE